MESYIITMEEYTFRTRSKFEGMQLRSNKAYIKNKTKCARGPTLLFKPK